jgi:hypothetical protein
LKRGEVGAKTTHTSEEMAAMRPNIGVYGGGNAQVSELRMVTDLVGAVGGDLHLALPS